MRGYTASRPRFVVAVRPKETKKGAPGSFQFGTGIRYVGRIQSRDIRISKNNINTLLLNVYLFYLRKKTIKHR